MGGGMNELELLNVQYTLDHFGRWEVSLFNYNLKKKTGLCCILRPFYE